MFSFLLFWNKSSKALDAQVNSVNNVFVKMINKLEKIKEKTNKQVDKNHNKISELNEKNVQYRKVSQKIHDQISKYQTMIVD